MACEEIILLVGGFGTRLKTVVPDLPKPLAPVAGRPFLAYLLDAFAEAGLRRAILATGHLADMIGEAIGTRWGEMEIAYSHENRPLGTGGAIRQASTFLVGGSAHIANGDTFLRYAPGALEQATRSAGAPLGIALAQVPDIGRYGAVDIVNGRVAGFREKGAAGPGLINAGSYFLTAGGLAALPEDEDYSFENAVLEPMAAAGRVAAFAQTADFIDIGVPEDYARAQWVFGEKP